MAGAFEQHKPKSDETPFAGRVSDNEVKPWFHAIARTKWQLLMTVITTALLAVTAWFARATYTTTSASSTQDMLSVYLGIDISSTLTILRVLQGLLSICTTYVLLNGFELLQWALMTEGGIRSLSLLGLSPTTGIVGTLALFVSKQAKWADRAAAISKVVLITALWVSGVALFVRTEVAVVYSSAQQYNVTAGVGRFNGSYISEYLAQYDPAITGYNYSVLPYSTVTTASNLAVNLMQSTGIDPVTCSDGLRCHGYLLSGGLIMTTPWPPTENESYPLVTLDAVPSVQIDFTRGIHNDSFVDAEDCMVFGEDGSLIGMKFCLAKSLSTPGSLFAGLFVCTEGIHDGECWTNEQPAEVTTTFQIYYRHATTINARSNMSILSVSKLDDPMQDMALDVEGLREAFAYLFNFTAADIPAPASISQYFWTVQEQLSDEYWSTEAYQIFESLLAFPFWLFQPNNFGNVRLDAQTIIDGLPQDMYTFGSIDAAFDHISVDRPMFILFCFLQAFALAYAWGILLWLWVTNPQLPQISSYPLIDFAMKTRFRHQYDLLRQDSDESTASKDSWSKHGSLHPWHNDIAIRKALKNEVVVIHRHDEVTESVSPDLQFQNEITGSTPKMSHQRVMPVL